MTVPTTIDAAGWLRNYLESDEGDRDLARDMLAAFAEALMSAEASSQCLAGYGDSPHGCDTQGGRPSGDDGQDCQVEQAPAEAASVEQATGTILGRDLVLFLLDLTSDFVPLLLEPPPQHRRILGEGTGLGKTPGIGDWVYVLRSSASHGWPGGNTRKPPRCHMTSWARRSSRGMW